ncbi:MAG: Chemoreceptor glutamine deamidase CheD [Deltaproteobacteria bacterium ADurb.BinA179]|nr:HDOD domain-containing protein [Deltaproteobacteria bacterium]MDI9542583.1 HDOD domain-containing protein [Pseudomonadota bacterium]OPZ28354.1 MAG: Chemoreceptor glutamine deamidase CheD [Deltaproteobacteria bacterium ADurb.BinA179]HRR21287.1 HDOD domain-containing protein [Desulfomonilia bacterium]HNR50004.1 HDOD domain-containing protein [Deltaproteobacteria bacterium]
MTTIVPTGEMVIGRRGLLKAFLSSCVGLAIYDRGNKLGGMLHILLPEPVSAVPDYHLSYYARTGVPALIEGMIEQGASPQSMEAFIAGGALVDHCSPHDLNLNFAHKTLEITLSCLKKYGVSIKMLEASGVNPFCLTFQLETGMCRIEPILLEKATRRVRKRHVGKDSITKTIERLLPVPQIAFNIGQMLADDDIDIATVAAEIKKDQVLSAKILRMCNSSYIGLPRQIASIDQAIVFLGSKLLLQIVITAQIENIFHASEGGYSLCRGGMFHHALATARLCRALAHEQGRIDPEIAYTAGLLHDIGKVVLDQYIADVQPLFYRMIIDHKENSCKVEQEIIGIDHCQAGLMLAKNWDLPDVLKDIMIYHHSPEIAENNREIVNLTYVADVLTNRFMPGLELEKVDTANLQASLNILGLASGSIYDHLAVMADIY